MFPLQHRVPHTVLWVHRSQQLLGRHPPAPSPVGLSGAQRDQPVPGNHYRRHPGSVQGYGESKMFLIFILEIEASGKRLQGIQKQDLRAVWAFWRDQVLQARRLFIKLMTSDLGLFLIALRPQTESDTRQHKIPNICFLPATIDSNLQDACWSNMIFFTLQTIVFFFLLCLPHQGICLKRKTDLCEHALLSFHCVIKFTAHT